MKKNIVGFVAIVATVAAFSEQSVEELKAEFSAAFKSNRPLSAESAFKKLSEAGAKLPAEMYYQAAEVARQIGRETVMNDRLARCVREDKSWNNRTEEALQRLLPATGRSEDYIRLVKNLKPDAENFMLGRAMLERFKKQSNAGEFTQVAEFMLEQFKEEWQRREVLYRFCWLVADRVPGADAAKLKRLMLAYPIDPGRAGDFYEPISRANAQYDPLFRMEWSLALGSVVSWPIFERICDFDPAKDQQYAKKVAEALNKVRPLVFKKNSDNRDWYRYQNCWVECKRRVIGQMFKPGATNEIAASCYADFTDAGAIGVDSGYIYAVYRNSGLFNSATDYWRKAHEEHPSYLWRDWACDWVPLTKADWEANNAKPLLDYAAKLASEEHRRHYYYARMYELARLGLVDLWKEIARRHVRDCLERRAVDLWRVADSLGALKGLDDAGKVAFLEGLYQETGSANFWDTLKAEANGGQKNREGWAYLRTEAGKRFIASIGPGRKPGEKRFALMMAIVSCKREGNGPREGMRLLKELMQTYPAGEFPAKPGPEDWRKNSKAGDNWLFRRAVEHAAYLADASNEAATEFVRTLYPFIANNNDRWYIDQVWNKTWGPDRTGQAQLLFDWREHLNKISGGKDPGAWNGFMLPKRVDKLPCGYDLSKVGAWDAVRTLHGNWNSREAKDRRYSEDAAVSAVVQLFSRKDLAGFDQNHLSYGFEALYSLAGNERLKREFPYDSVAGQLFKAPDRTWMQCCFLTFCRYTGRFDQYFAKYRESFKNESAAFRANRLIAVAGIDRWWYREKKKNADGKEYEELVDKAWMEYLDKTMIPALDAVPYQDAPRVWFGEGNTIFDRINSWGGSYGWNREEKDRNRLVLRVRLACARLLAGGAYRETPSWHSRCWCFVSQFDEALDKTNVAEIVRMATDFGRANPVLSNEQYRDRLQKVRALGLWDALYLAADPGAQSNDGGIIGFSSELRAEAASHLPGVYPVPESDPTYPLYVAADELSQKNFEKARALLLGRVDVFERAAGKLPAAFTAWAVDQLRMERGEKDALLVRARNIATQLLNEESRLTPELAAAMLLVRAECYRDQRNFEAAKLEYQSIRNNPRYQKTESARKAMFRDASLSIETGNSAAVEPLIEYWLSQNDMSIQAEAHYFAARIAFERKDYDQCIKELREVFAIDFTHTAARFLQGQWKLATNNEVDETEVMIGSLTDRSSVRPGQELSVTVQDRNLSVAGGGSSIPVVVTTAPGGDREIMNLYPSARDPNLFRGTIAVVLGKASVSNMVVEVAGNDKVAYEIEPEFLKARGLKSVKPKVLTVVDDARLAIGTGAPRADEEDSAAQVSAMVADGGAESTEAVSRELRPGNPLYVAVSDKDRSLGTADCAITARVRTSSGDEVKASLKETAPYSGIFRARIETALPPPRAFASDTATGFNPGDAINRGKTGIWRSLSDGKAGKWFEVDTMDSHLVSNVTIRMTSPGQVTGVRLIGRMAGKSWQLGAFPAAKVETRLGLRRQEIEHMRFNWADEARNRFDRHDAPRSYAVSNLVVKPRWTDRATTTYIKGVFALAEGETQLRWQVKPLQESADTFRSLRLVVAIDGKTVLDANGSSLRSRIFTTRLGAEPHRLEIIATTDRAYDGFEIVAAPKEGPSAPVAYDLFDPAKHPEFVAFASDKAAVERTDEGFTAVFPEPVRVRSLRWEFIGMTGTDLSISDFTAVDAEGKKFLPVDNDYSTAKDNEILEVAPGDAIKVAYEDEVNSSGSKRVLEQSITSRFTDARVSFAFEAFTGEEDWQGNRHTALYNAYRFVPGDLLVVTLDDNDLDATGAADEVEVEVAGKSGKLKVKLVEQQNPSAREGDEVHTGRFRGLLRTRPAGSRQGTHPSLEVVDGEVVSIAYEDRENTNPGVPTVRTASVQAIGETPPAMTLFAAEKVRIEDTSAVGKRRLEALRRRPGNENLSKVYTTRTVASPMTGNAAVGTNEITVNISAPLPVRVNDLSRARHAASRLVLEAWSDSEVERAESEEDDVHKAKAILRLGGGFGEVELTEGVESPEEAAAAGSFNGILYFTVGSLDAIEGELAEKVRRARTGTGKREMPAIVPVTGSDKVHLRLLEDDKVLAEKTLALAADATMALTDPSGQAERSSVHGGERLLLVINDADRDATDEPDQLEVSVKSLASGLQRNIFATETGSHTGVFKASLRPTFFIPGEEIPSVCTTRVEDVETSIADDRFPASYGERIEFSYIEPLTLAGDGVRTLTATGMVHRGADGKVQIFSKSFRDVDEGVLVQFRLAECLFEQAKDFRKLKSPEKSAAAIERGRNILEETIKAHPDSSHAAQSEFLLANLYKELAAEAKEDKKPDEERRLLGEALARFSTILAVWPDGEYAARAQYNKAYCLEMLKEYQRAAEEYVKMTYLYPESDLVGDAAVRLATHYYQREKKYAVSARIYANFQKRFPTHDKAARALFMSGQCYIKEAEAETARYHAKDEEAKKQGKLNAAATGAYELAAKTFARLPEEYRSSTPPEFRAQALYWAGDTTLRIRDSKASYRYLRSCVMDFPETEWARRARGLLLQYEKDFNQYDNKNL